MQAQTTIIQPTSYYHQHPGFQSDMLARPGGEE